MREPLTAGAVRRFYAKSAPTDGVSSHIKNLRITMERQEGAPRKAAEQAEPADQSTVQAVKS